MMSSSSDDDSEEDDEEDEDDEDDEEDDEEDDGEAPESPMKRAVNDTPDSLEVQKLKVRKGNPVYGMADGWAAEERRPVFYII